MSREAVSICKAVLYPSACKAAAALKSLVSSEMRVLRAPALGLVAAHKGPEAATGQLAHRRARRAREQLLQAHRLDSPARVAAALQAETRAQ